MNISRKRIGVGIKIWFMEYQLKQRIWGFSLMEIFGPLLIVAIIIGIIQY
jgi:hypothetical protein